MHPAVIKILEKYDYQMPKPLSNQRFNEYIKEVAKIAGIDQVETTRKTIGGKIQTERKPKYELIGTHTGRRSFCTNMYLLGIPTYTIMAISGHKTEKSFIKYVRITKEQHARFMRKAWEQMYIKEVKMFKLEKNEFVYRDGPEWGSPEEVVKLSEGFIKKSVEESNREPHNKMRRQLMKEFMLLDGI